MRITSIAALTTMLLVAACSHPRTGHEGAKSGEEHEAGLDVRTIAERQHTSIADAIAAALAGRSGEALEAGLEGERENGSEQVFIEVMVLGSDGKPLEVKVDAATGKVLSAMAPDEADEAAELAELKSRIPAGSLSLADLVRRAAGAAPGRLVSAAFESNKRGTVAEVVFVDGRKSVEVKLDPKTGSVLSRDEETEEEEGEEEDEG